MRSRLEYQRQYRRSNSNALTKRYEKTSNGFLMRLYRNMKSRVSGVQMAKFHLYEGKELLTKEEFYSWAKDNPEFLTLYQQYVEEGYPRRLAPSVDRKNADLGYTISNMEWVTMSVNSARSRRIKKK